MTDTLTILKAAREFLADPDHWTQGIYGVKDNSAIPRDQLLFNKACTPEKCCTVGAVYWAAPVEGRPTAFWSIYSPDIVDACKELSYTIRDNAWWTESDAFQSDAGLLDFAVAELADFNDHDATHADVLDLFDRTIARLEAAA